MQLTVRVLDYFPIGCWICTSTNLICQWRTLSSIAEASIIFPHSNYEVKWKKKDENAIIGLLGDNLVTDLLWILAHDLVLNLIAQG